VRILTVAAEPQVYELLAQALIYPDGSFAASIRARVQALSSPAPWATAIVDALAGTATGDLQSEHVRLFINAYGGSPCLPYESVYAEGRVLGEVAREVAQLYAEWGVEETGEMPDHAAVELAFAAQLARLSRLPESGEDRQLVRWAQESFEQDHLRAWLPVLGAKLQAAAEFPFYRAVGAALVAVFGTGSGAGWPGVRGGSTSHLFPDLST
jgi:putative dimethyl sulfoxide reductase chaperone